MYSFSKGLADVLPTSENMLVSPVSLQMALLNATLGSKGTTRTQLLKVLGLPVSLNNQMIVLTMKYIAQESLGQGITMANGLFIEQTYGVNSLYLEIVAADTIRPMNFAGAPDVSRIQMNDFVAKATHDRILNLLQSGSIDSQTKLVIINALHFKLPWLYKYDEENTYLDHFYLPGSSTMVQMMHQTNSSVPYYQDMTFSALVMPYAGSNMTRLYVLPAEGVSINSVENRVHEIGFSALLEMMSPENNLEIAVPKFRMGWGTTNMIPHLMSLGVVDAFGTDADFSGMSASSVKDLYVSGVFHKTWMEDNEFGSEMAAATAVVTREKAISMPAMFNANRPFAFYNLVPNGSGVLPLFMGRLVDPRQL